ncbi:MAG: hypothetical protein ACOY3P_15185 [Planctomycetota bacterium]
MSPEVFRFEATVAWLPFCLFSRWLYPRRAMRRVARLCARLANHRWLAVVAVFVLACALCALMRWQRGLHTPHAHDEFAYLLAADTFASGRVTNPRHPLWMHFESIHILQQPSYAAKYPPGQGLFLALGTVVFGHPMAGVYLSFALACAAVCWMMQAWMPARWAMFGGVLTVLSLATTSWANTYWGGAVAALGGALLFGALRRLIDRPAVVQSLLFVLGVAILANTRPYEGLVASAAAVAALLLNTVRQGQWRRPVFWGKVMLPLLGGLALTAGWMGWYNRQVTGSPWLMPYQAHDAAYAAAPVFLWQPPLAHGPEYRHTSMRDYYVGHELTRYEKKRALWGLNLSLGTRVYAFGLFFVGPLFAIPLLVLAIYNRRRWLYFAAIVCGLELLALSQTLYLHPHYAAPVTGLVMVLNVFGLRNVRLWKGLGGSAGRCYVAGTVIVLTAGLAYYCTIPEVTSPRVAMQADLEARGERHLVVVRYGPQHECHHEWVYNAADIDAAPVVWARDMGPERNMALLRYFSDRKFWLLTANGLEASLAPWPEEHPASTAEIGGN